MIYPTGDMPCHIRYRVEILMIQINFKKIKPLLKMRHCPYLCQVFKQCWDIRPTSLDHHQPCAGNVPTLAGFNFVQPSFQTGTPLDTTWYITDKGDRVWLRFDASRPCYMFSTTETRQGVGWGELIYIFSLFRFFKPKLHTHIPDPYQKR